MYVLVMNLRNIQFGEYSPESEPTPLLRGDIPGADGHNHHHGVLIFPYVVEYAQMATMPSTNM